MPNTTSNTRIDRRVKTWRFAGIGSIQDGKVGYILMWLLGVPLPLLVIWFLVLPSSTRLSPSVCRIRLFPSDAQGIAGFFYAAEENRVS